MLWVTRGYYLGKFGSVKESRLGEESATRVLKKMSLFAEKVGCVDERHLLSLQMLGQGRGVIEKLLKAMVPLAVCVDHQSKLGTMYR